MYLVYFQTIEKTHRCLFDNGEIKTLLNLPPYGKFHRQSMDTCKAKQSSDE